jgi:phage gp29-like protein
VVDILDHRGNKIEKEALKEPQTAKIAQLHQEFANHPTRGLTPSRLAQIMEDAERGDLIAQCDLFEDMEEKDGHIMAELGKRKRALLGLEWYIKPPRKATPQEEKIAGLVQDIILDVPNFEDVLLDMADGIGHGYSCLEYQWQRNKYWQPAAIDHRPPRWFTVNKNKRNQLRLRDNTAEGQELWNAGWIVHIHKAKSGYLTRAGLHRALAWPFLFKNYSVRDLAEFLEIYGLPVRLGQYPRGATDGEKNTLLRAVVNMGHAAAGIIPEGMLVEFKEAAKGGSDPYVAMMDWCERTQSKAILGGTLTSQADGASSTNALGNVHNEVRRDLLVADAAQIASTLTRDLVFNIVRLNGLGHDPLRAWRFVFDTVECEDLALYSEAIPKLVDIGTPVPVSYVQNKLRIPEPENNEPVLKRLAPSAPAGITKPTVEALAAAGSIVALMAKINKDTQDPTSTDSQTQQLAKQAASNQNDWITVLKAKVDKAENLEALRDDLLDSYGDLDSEELTNIMTIAFASAELSGRFDVENEQVQGER